MATASCSAASAPKLPPSQHTEFPIDLSKFQQIKIDPFATKTLCPETKKAFLENIQLVRDAIVFFTSCGAKSGYGGHTGGAYDTVPELLFLDSFFKACPDKFVPIFFDEAGHRVASQYIMSVLHGHMEAKQLIHYRQGHFHLPGHPELGVTPGVKFSSGRLGHMWPMVNGYALANKDRVTFCLGSDGSQMEGGDAEAARLAVSEGINVKLIIDDNNVTIAGHPQEYFKGYSVEKTLAGHGMDVKTVSGEDVDALYSALRYAVTTNGPVAIIIKRNMMPGIKGMEGSCHGHDVISVDHAVQYLTARGHKAAVATLAKVGKTADPQSEYLGVTGKVGSNRDTFGQTVAQILSTLSPAKKKNVMCIDSDLEGSTGLKHIHKAHKDIYIQSGIMERGNFAAAAGFGMQEGKQGIFATFAAFLEMLCSEITMARLNHANVLCHFSHSGVDFMADNTCHYGLNNFFADNGLDEHAPTELYFPCDHGQMAAVVNRVFNDKGLRFVFSIRSKLKLITDTDGKPIHGPDYVFTPGKDEVVRKGSAGYIVTFGDAVYRCLDAVERMRKEGVDVGLINKVHLNAIDEDVMSLIGQSPAVLVVEPLNRRTGLGIRFGTDLLKRGLHPKYDHIGTSKEGCGGTWEHCYHQGYDSASVQKKFRSLI